MVQLRIKNVWKDFRLPVSTFATVARKRFNGKITAKNAYTDAAIGSLRPRSETVGRWG